MDDNPIHTFVFAYCIFFKCHLVLLERFLTVPVQDVKFADKRTLTDPSSKLVYPAGAVVRSVSSALSKGVKSLARFFQGILR